MAQNRKQSTLKLNRKQTKKSTLYEPREGGKEGGVLICIHMYMCTHMTITSVFAFVYMGFIFVCIYLGNCAKKRACMSFHILIILYFMYIWKKKK